MEVLPVSSVTGEGIAAVGALLGPGRTGAMVAPSGVGKSSWPTPGGEVLAETRDIRAADGRGRTPPRRANCTCSPAAGCSSTPRGCASSASTTTPGGWTRLCRRRLLRLGVPVPGLRAPLQAGAARSPPPCSTTGTLDPARYSAWRKLQAEAHRQLLQLGTPAPSAGANTAAHLPSQAGCRSSPTARADTALGWFPPRARGRASVPVPGTRPVRGALLRSRGERAPVRTRQRRHASGPRAHGGRRHRSRCDRRARGLGARTSS